MTAYSFEPNVYGELQTAADVAAIVAQETGASPIVPLINTVFCKVPPSPMTFALPPVDPNAGDMLLINLGSAAIHVNFGSGVPVGPPFGGLKIPNGCTLLLTQDAKIPASTIRPSSEAEMVWLRLLRRPHSLPPLGISALA